jgi:Ca-activated chloride channel family protein
MPRIDQFADKSYLYLLALLPLLAIWMIWRSRKQQSGMQFSSTQILEQIPAFGWVRWRFIPNLLRLLALAFGIIALARPQSTHTSNEKYAEGIDIMLVMDVSTSMKAMDFSPDRFHAAQEVASNFIASRVSDRVGLIVFAAQAYTQFPLTLDYDFAQDMLRDVQMDVIEDGTAIGTALATATNRLKDSKAKSKVVILLTDGQNNHGEVDPLTASEVAATTNVRVYTIGVGKHGKAPYPIPGQGTVQVDVDIDEPMLKQVAANTGGKYFRATNNGALESIYRDISELEKTKIEQRIYTDAEEVYPFFLWIGLGLLLLEVTLRTTTFRTFP